MLKARRQNSDPQSKTTATSTSATAKPQPKVKKASVPTEESTPTTSISTVPTRRNAATQATQKLRDVIMPAKNRFEQQMKKSRKSSGGATRMQWDDRKMKETSVRKRRKRAFEVRSDGMDIDGEREEEEDAAGRRSMSKSLRGQLGEGRVGRLVPAGKRKSGCASLMLWARGSVNANRRIM